MKLNTISGGSANRDGVLEQWIDGTKTTDEHSMRFTDHPENGVNYLWHIWHGGSNPAPQDQGLWVDNWALSTTDVPDISGSSTTTPSDDTQQEAPDGTVFELVTSQDMPTTQYQFTVDGSVQKRTDAGDVSAEGNDAIVDNSDGDRHGHRRDRYGLWRLLLRGRDVHVDRPRRVEVDAPLQRRGGAYR